MKRITHLPQLILGMAYSWCIPMAYAATLSHLPVSCWLLFLANMCWTIAYDTQYALVDKEDDLKINIKSTAILFGDYAQQIILMLQLITLVLLILVGKQNQLGIAFYFALIVAVLLFIYQQLLLRTQDKENYFNAFLNNNLVGFIIFLGICCSYLRTIIL